MSQVSEYVDQGIALLQAQIGKLEALKEKEHDIAGTLAHAQQIWKGKGWVWILRENAVLNNEAPIDLLLRGESQVVDDLLYRIEYGIAV
jgi:uncharacterized protein (DUF2384 family)